MKAFLRRLQPFFILIIGIALFIGGVYLGISIERNLVVETGVEYDRQENQPTDVDFAPFWDVWNTLDLKYIGAAPSSEETTDQDRVWGAIQGLTRSLGDPYTVFFPPVEAEFFEGDISGEFSGVGMEIGIRDNLLTVIAPIKYTPAMRAGIRAEDIIVRIDGEDSLEFSPGVAARKIRGPRGEEVLLTISRKNEPELLEIPVVRDTIIVPTIETSIIDDEIFLLELYNFNESSPILFRQGLQKFGDTWSENLSE